MKKKNKQLRKSDEYHQVLSYLINNPNTAFNYKQLAAKLDDINPKDVGSILNLLVRDSKIENIDRSKYIYRKSNDEVIGTIDFNQRGDAYVTVENLDKDIKIRPGDTLDAFQGDTVKVRVGFTKKAAKPRAFVTEVVHRARTTFVGTLSISGNIHFVIADSNKVHTDFFIPPEKTKGANHGDKVLVKLGDWPARAKNPYANIIEVFGKAGSNSAEMHAIVAEFGFSTSFPPAVEHQAQQLSIDIEKELSNRKDYREVCTFTIDPEDAKDFDDALSFQKLDNGNIEVGVHIADVSHFVEEGGAIDAEAVNRATSVYLVDRTIPMLPERLSNELCSLRPHEDSLCFAVLFTLDKNAKVLKYEFAKTIIYSDHRFAYEDAQDIIKGAKHELSEEIIQLNNLSKILRQQRFDNGAINFETTEFKFDLDDQGKPVKVIPKLRFDAHKLIEEFMLLANKYVAMHMYTKNDKAPIPYRVHEEPSAEKLQEFATTAATFGHKIDIQDYKKLSHSINEMVRKIEGTLEGDILQPLAIRSMEKAYYTSKKSGHFGLAFEYYGHFTSPIRRYPDLITHRILHEYLLKKKTRSSDQIEPLCKHCSEQEQKAVNAERASIKYKQVEYLGGFKGEEFEGIISGVTEWGIYVEIIENKCEGMIRVKEIKGDNYNYFPEKKKVIGARTKKTYGMGDRVWIKVKQTNLQRRTVDFEFINE